MATMRSPLRSILARTSPARPRRTPSGLIRTRVRSDNVLPPSLGAFDVREQARVAGNHKHRVLRQSYRRQHPTGRITPGQDLPKSPAAAPLASTDAPITGKPSARREALRQLLLRRLRDHDSVRYSNTEVMITNGAGRPGGSWAA